MTLKTSKSIVKRFKLTKKGKIRYRYGGKSHLLSKKESDRKRRLKRPGILKGRKIQRTIRRLLPYG